ncbi:RNA-binding protein Nova-1-like isoform X2 [Actinia tenebrosa]|uniref:RNA-binding protein Nova-1-like isoform X2 n=1 Tax=Actinia tenebrosa TaxID=6105 RepID=A0A6P8IJ17_ACTTE|nr:RNA-binding protein Nova-1-like isoform X2 [Actinia tenebrosa]
MMDYWLGVGLSQTRNPTRQHLPAAKSPILKILVPNYAAGSIIGKGGQNIAQVQQSTGARIKLSPNNHYYPGTQERIGLIIGEVDTIITMLDFVIDKIRQEPQGAKVNSNITFDRERAKQMKIVVPNSTAGMIIGKGGTAIKSISEQTGARIQISQKDADSVAGERVVCVSGEEDQVQAACAIITAKVQEDPEHALNNNIMYTGLTTSRGGHSNGHFGSNLPLSALSGFGGLGLPNTGSQGSQAAAPNHILAQAALMQSGSNALSSALGMPPTTTATTSSSIHSSATLEITVPDELIGAILGKGGKTINEFMQYSGARIQVSQKGEFVPGTSNRKVVITGDVQAAQLAHFLITQRLQQVEAERLVSPPHRA